MKRQIPNILSALRIVMIGGFVGMFVTGQYFAALFVYLLAFLTDILDGYLARSNGWITDVGKLLDPLADKLMTLTVLTCAAAADGSLLLGLVTVLSFLKELLLIVGGALLLRYQCVVSADWAGKIAVGLYGMGIVMTLIGFAQPAWRGYGIAVLVAATAAAYGAMLHYALVFFARKRGKSSV